MPRPASALVLPEADQQQLRQWISAFGTPQQVALRSQIVLAAAEGQSDNAIAQQLEINRKTVGLWRTRFMQEGLDSLWEVAPGRGRKPTYGLEKIQSIVEATLGTKPIRNDPVELPAYGSTSGSQQVHHQQYLAESQPQTASGENLQAVTGCQVSGKVNRCGGSLSESSPTSDRAMRG